MLTRLPKLLFDHVLNSVPFGISTMALLAAYIAVGSGVPEVREHFEMHELEFFSAWPLVALVVLLVANLTVVTWVRIPFTPPRYGVWMIHTGIITLILGMVVYYSLKVEGVVRIFGGQTVDYYYDRFERSLYARVDGRPAGVFPLRSLPRFNAYDDLHGNAEKLDRPDLRNRVPVLATRDSQTGQRRDLTLKQAFQLPDELKLDVIGYYPYATIGEQILDDPENGRAGLKLELTDPHTGSKIDRWLLGFDPKRRVAALHATELEHHHTDSTMLAALREAASKMHRIDASAGDFAQTLYVEPGQTYTLGDTGYSFAVEFFQPNWSMFGTSEPVDSLVLMVTTPTQTFRRMVLNGKDVQTDFLLNTEGAGPMGKRQTTRLDSGLVLKYAFNDPYHLLPRDGSTKHNLVSVVGGTAVVDIVTSSSKPAVVHELPEGTGQIVVQPDHGSPMMGGGSDHEDPPIPMQVTRHDRVRVEQIAQIVPSAQRQRQVGEAGLAQVLKVRVSMGDWSEEVYVPFAEDVLEMPWSDPTIQIPGSHATLALQLGNTRLQLPARLTLDEFELVPYPGGDKSPRSMFRDFKSRLTVEDPRTGDRVQAVAHMNNPIYFDRGNWLFFQSAWDPEGQRWTVLGIGNRPGVWTMTIGCTLMFVGLFYAFYVKPIIVRRMKQNALARAGMSGGGNGRSRRASPARVVEPEVVSSK